MEFANVKVASTRNFSISTAATTTPTTTSTRSRNYTKNHFYTRSCRCCCSNSLQLICMGLSPLQKFPESSPGWNSRNLPPRESGTQFHTMFKHVFINWWLIEIGFLNSGCDYQGKHYANGKEWSDPQDPCRVNPQFLFLQVDWIHWSIFSQFRIDLEETVSESSQAGSIQLHSITLRHFYSVRLT